MQEMDICRYTAEEQALLDMYKGSLEEKKEQLVKALGDVEDEEMAQMMRQLIVKM